jgi:DNA-binding CsgD family transcriptional regulator
MNTNAHVPDRTQGPRGAASPAEAAPPAAEPAAAWHPGDMAARTRSPVLVGRGEQLAVLEAALAPSRPDSAVPASGARVPQTPPSVVLIGGEAGVGKSRLMAEFTARSRAAGARVLTGGCVELGTDGLPFAPFTAVLRELVHELGADGVAELLPGGATRDFARLLPEFGTAGAEAGDAVARARLFEQMLTLLERLAESGPVALVVEDAHWADRSTRDLLAFLVGRQQILDGVLIVVTYRSDEMHRTHPLRPLVAELGRLGWVERIELGRLDRIHADELVARILGRPPEPSLADEMYRRAEGNPLFIEELLESGRAEGRMPGVPDSLRDLLLVSVRQLPEETQDVLRTASVGGQRNGHALLAAVTGQGDDALSAALRSAVAANVLTADADGYTFRHGLIREAILDDLLPGDHTRLHTRFAEALEADPRLVPPGRAVIEQAHHWYAAHDTLGALVSSWRAAAEAGQALAHAEQLTLLARVLELWAKVPDAEQRIGASQLSVMERATQVAQTAGESDRAAAFASAALDLIDPDAEPVRTALLLETRALLTRRSGHGEVVADMQAALDLVPPGTDDAARARVLVSMARHAWHMDGAPATAAVDEALALARRAGDVSMEATALLEVAVIASRDGHDEQALDLLGQARVLAERGGALEPQMYVVINESHVLEGIGQHERAADVARAGVARAEKYGLARSSGTFLAINVAEPLVSLGRWDEATEVIEYALAQAPPQPGRQALLRQLAGEIALRRGDLAEAAQSAADARAALGSIGIKRRGQYDIPVARLEIEVRLAEGKLAEALAAVAAALAGTDDRDLDVSCDPRYAWPLLAASARVIAAFAADSRAAARDGARAADLLACLHALAGRMPVLGPVQRANEMTFRAEALRAERPERPERPEHAADQAARELLDAFDAAASAWEAIGQPYALALALLQGAHAALAAGDRDGAAQRLARVTELSERLAARPLLAQARTLARAARIRPSGPGAAPTAPLGLTPREFEVLRLVADGRSNPEIAAQLYISAKTASVHVSSILTKVGVASRGEAAAAAHRLRLV